MKGSTNYPKHQKGRELGYREWRRGWFLLDDDDSDEFRMDWSQSMWDELLSFNPLQYARVISVYSFLYDNLEFDG